MSYDRLLNLRVVRRKAVNQARVHLVNSGAASDGVGEIGCAIAAPAPVEAARLKQA